MRILLTNDDGINAEGLALLERLARKISHDVIVVAPETDQSGVAHSLSLNEPMRLREIDRQRYAVRGTPTDCVIMAMRRLLRDAKPDLLISGVNRGQNVAEDVTYSGTIAAAMEGTLLGVPSIALSQAYRFGEGRAEPAWACAEAHGEVVIRRILAEGIPPEVLINVNFPGCTPEEVAGAAIAVQGRRDADFMDIEERRDGRGLPYYWLMFSRQRVTPGHGTDLDALDHRKISITPLRLDLTDEPTLTRYAGAFRDFAP